MFCPIGFNSRKPGGYKEQAKRMKVWIIMSLLIAALAVPCEAKIFKFGKQIGKKLGEKVMRDTRRNEAKEMLKRIFSDKRLTKFDIELINNFISRRIKGTTVYPYGRNFYKNRIEEIGYKLIDPDLTTKDYELIIDFLRGIYRNRKNLSWLEKVWGALGIYGRQTIIHPWTRPAVRL